VKRIVTRGEAIAWFKDQGFLHWPACEAPGEIGIAGESERVVMNVGRLGPDDPGVVIDVRHDTFVIRPEGARWFVDGDEPGGVNGTIAGDGRFDSLHDAALEVSRCITALRRERGRGHDAVADALSQLRMRGFVVRSDRQWSRSRILLFDATQSDSADAVELKRSRAVFSLSFDPQRGDWLVQGYREPHRGEDVRFEALHDAIAWLAVRLNDLVPGDTGRALR
jgi:hypothetical protein